MQIFNILLGLLGMASAGPATESYKDQFCTDPRTMRKHPAYSEWADAYSCSRHRCQPGGRNLAIYTVGCKRVEAPESAIECEEVVEDTNMQFPYCCTRLRCLVVVRGEVWTRVLGQPWETLPAAPWSHMYKMKKPPPTDGTFLPKSPGDGPVYELQTEADSKRDQVLRASKKGAAEGPDCNDVVPRAAPTPDIVIALSTNTDVKALKKNDRRHKRGRKAHFKSRYFDDEAVEPRNMEHEETSTDKPLTPSSEERYDANAYEVTQKPLKSQPQVSWTEIPKNQLNEHEPSMDAETLHTEREQEHEPTSYIQPEPLPEEKKPTNLQALVDAIGTRMRDIENVVQRMSEKVKPPSNDADIASAEKRSLPDTEIQTQKHHSKERKEGRTKKPNFDGDNYKRFTKHGSKYIHGAPDGSTEQPLFVEDSNLNGYYSDASNSMLRRANPPKEPAATYMAPVDTRRNTPAHISIATDFSEEEKREKKHTHTKKKQHVHHKKHHSKDKRKRLNRLNSVELDKNAVSLEDSGASQ